MGMATPDYWSIPEMTAHGVSLAMALEELGVVEARWKARFFDWLGAILEDQRPFENLPINRDGSIHFTSASAMHEQLAAVLATNGALAGLFALTDDEPAAGIILSGCLAKLGTTADEWKAGHLKWFGVITDLTGLLSDNPTEPDGSVHFASELQLRTALLPRLTRWGALASVLALGEIHHQRGG